MKDFQSGNSKVDVILLLTITLLSLFLFLLPVKFKEELERTDASLTKLNKILEHTNRGVAMIFSLI